jgi:hypothetical protein
MSHTPGPWAVSFKRTEVEGVNVSFCVDAGAAINIAGGQSQEHLVGHSPIFEAECRANARLIAAAPELLHALKGFTQSLAKIKSGDYVIARDSIWIDAAHAAIAKATEEA